MSNAGFVDCRSGNVCVCFGLACTSRDGIAGGNSFNLNSGCSRLLRSLPGTGARNRFAVFKPCDIRGLFREERLHRSDGY